MTFEEAMVGLGELARGGVEVPGSVRLELRESTARIVIDNPDSRNAMTLRMMVELGEAVRHLRAWSGAVVILEATGERAFCSGGHLKDVLTRVRTAEQARMMCMAMGTVLNELRALPVLSVTWVQGLALGGGAELATSGDLLFMSAEAKVHFVHARLGIVPGWGGAGRLRARVGDKVAESILAEATPMGARRCLQVGLAGEVYSGRAAMLKAQVEPRAMWGHAAVQALKQACGWRPGSGTSGLEDEAMSFARVWLGEAHREALDSRGLV